MRNQCSHDDCDRLVHARGFCIAHYRRARSGSKWTTPIGVTPERRSIDKYGYVIVNSTGHPNVLRQGRSAIYEHTLVMSVVLGRALMPGESVHHKNGIRSDNDPKNLELWVKSRSQPPGQRVSDKLIWIRDFCASYVPDAVTSIEEVIKRHENTY